jgi:hypothetical protein
MNMGARDSAVWGAKLGSDGSPRRAKRVQGENRGTAWRVILQASPATLPSERTMNLVLLCNGLEINDLCFSLREIVLASGAEGWLIIVSA